MKQNIDLTLFKKHINSSKNLNYLNQILYSNFSDEIKFIALIRIVIIGVVYKKFDKKIYSNFLFSPFCNNQMKNLIIQFCRDENLLRKFILSTSNINLKKIAYNRFLDLKEIRHFIVNKNIIPKNTEPIIKLSSTMVQLAPYSKGTAYCGVLFMGIKDRVERSFYMKEYEKLASKFIPEIINKIYLIDDIHKDTKDFMYIAFGDNKHFQVGKSN